RRLHVLRWCPSQPGESQRLPMQKQELHKPRRRAKKHPRLAIGLDLTCFAGFSTTLPLTLESPIESDHVSDRIARRMAHRDGLQPCLYAGHPHWPHGSKMKK